MHRLPSQTAVTRFRLASFLLISALLSAFLCLGFVGYSIYEHDKSLMITGIALLLATVILVIFQLIVSSRARCPLCLTPALASKACSKHRNAKRLLGSYRFRVATSIITNGHFRCPYCGEPTAIEVRPRRAHEA